MARSKRHIFFRGLFVGLISVLPVLVLAQTSQFVTCTGPQGTPQPCDFNSLFGQNGLLGKVVNYTITYLLVPIATIAILYAGIRLVWPSGRPTVQAEMKKLLGTVVVGMMFVFAAWLIVQAIINGLADSGTKPGSAALQLFNSSPK